MLWNYKSESFHKKNYNCPSLLWTVAILETYYSTMNFFVIVFLLLSVALSI